MTFNLEINFLGDKWTVLDLDSTDYGYLSLLTDVCGVVIANRIEWLNNMIKVEGVMPNTDDTIAIHSDEDIKSLIAVYLSLGLENILVNLDIIASISKENIIGNSNMIDIHESNKLVDTQIVVYNEAEDEGNIEVDERFVWSDSEFEIDNIEDQCEVPDSNTDEDMDNLSDYNSDTDQSLYHIDETSSVCYTAEALSDNIKDKYFEFDHDNYGNQIIMLKEGMLFDPASYKWLMETCGEHPSNWSWHGFDTTSKIDHVTNNMSESFNAFLVKMRKMPIITLLEWYRRKIMKRFFTRYSKTLNWKTKLPPNVNAKVEKNQREGRKLLVMPASNFMFEVHDNKKYIVNLNDKTCQCREWQVCGVPCKHAMSCILYMRYDPAQFVDSYLTTEAYLKTYSGMINAISDESKWPENSQIPPLNPPIHKKAHKVFKQCRLQTSRRREPNEALKKQKRSIHVSLAINAKELATTKGLVLKGMCKICQTSNGVKLLQGAGLRICCVWEKI